MNISLRFSFSLFGFSFNVHLHFEPLKNKRILVQKIVGPKKYESKITYGPKNAWLEKFWCKKSSQSKTYWSKKLDKKKSQLEKILGPHEPIFKVWLELDWDIIFH